MKPASRSTPSFAGLFSAALVFALAATTSLADESTNLVTLCYRNRTIQVPLYLAARYLAVAGTTFGACTPCEGNCYTAPVFVTQPQGATGYVGGGVTFTSSATASPVPTYQWRFNNNPIPGATTSNLTLLNLQSTNVGDYQVVAANAISSVTSAVAHLTVLTDVVTTNADSGPGSLRSVIANAPDNISIGFADHVRGTITLTSGELLINKNIIIIGPGADLLTVRRDDAASDFRIMRVEGNHPSVTISGLTIANGKTTFLDQGGGIRNAGDLTLRNCAVSSNSSPFGGSGGAIFSVVGSALLLDSCTISQNTAGQSGGAVLVMGTFYAANSTFSSNSAPNTGGIYLLNTAYASLRNCTVSGNGSSAVAGHAGGVNSANALVYIGNTIVAGNTGGASPDIVGTVTSDGNNLIGDGGASVGLINGVDHDLVGTAGSPINPLLDILKNNGGPTKTRALLPGSPAIDAAKQTNAPAKDQRGFLRFGIADIGAFEVAAGTFSITSIERLPDGSERLRGRGAPNRSYRVEFSPDLSTGSFLTLDTTTCDDSGDWQFTDSFASLAPKWFYRLADP